MTRDDELGRVVFRWVGLLTVALVWLVLVLHFYGDFFRERVVVPAGAYFFDDARAGVSYAELRAGVVAPDCDPDIDVEAAVAKQMKWEEEPPPDVDIFLTAGPLPTREQVRAAIVASIHLCRLKIAHYHVLQARETLGLRWFRGLDDGLGWISRRHSGGDPYNYPGAISAVPMLVCCGDRR